MQFTLTKETISELIESDSFPYPELRKVATELNVLPMFTEMGGWYGLTLSGDIVSASWDDVSRIRVEHDRRIRNLVLFHGVKAFPALEELKPSKGESDETCPECKGTGRHPLSEPPNGLNIGCYCGGLGWIPKAIPD